MAREISETERAHARDLLAKARRAMCLIESYDQAKVDRLCQAVAWAVANEKTFTRLSHMSVDESGLGDRDARVNKRFKIMGILRDALRQKSMGIIEEIPEKGIVKYAKPAGVVASLVPVTNASLTEAGNGINALKCKDAIIFSPHPSSRKTTNETVRIMRAAMEKQGAPADIFQCIEKPSIPLAQELMSICDLTVATGGSGDGAGGVQFRQTGLWCRRRQCHHGHRRDGQH
jgi:sulfoacetaldehyde dehydrogenase